MGLFTIFMHGGHDKLVIDAPASDIGEMEQVVRSSRFLGGMLLDVPDTDGVCSDRAALISVPQIRLIMQGVA